MTDEITTTNNKEQLPEQLHHILEEWSKLIMSLASLIRENIEGLLPAVFGLANMAQRVSEGSRDARESARGHGDSLRDRIKALAEPMSPLSDAAADAMELRNILETVGAQARTLRPLAAGKPELEAFLDSLSADKQSAVPRIIRLLDTTSTLQTAGSEALLELDSGLEVIDGLMHANTAELEAAAARVKIFVESTKAAIDELIVKLQFQDRTDQILQHLLKDFESLSNALSEVSDQPFDAEAWREARAKRFTTNEEKTNQPSSGTGDVELF